MPIDQQLTAAWVSAGAAAVQAVGAVGAILVAVKLARDSERRAIESERASIERELAAERASVARAEAADRDAEERIIRSLNEQRKGMVETIAMLARELLDEVNEAFAKADEQFGDPKFDGIVSGGNSPKRTPELVLLIPDWKLGAKDAGLVKAITQLERAIQPWKTESGGVSGPSYVAKFKAQRDGIEAAIIEIESFARDRSTKD